MIEWLADNGGVYNSAHTGQQIDDAVSAAAGAASADLTNVLDTDFINKAESAGVGTRIETVSYVGTGLYGASNPTIITASFEPKLIVITATGVAGLVMHFEPNGLSLLPLEAIPRDDSFYVVFTAPQSISARMLYFRRSLDGKTISWYSGSDIEQMNASGITYYCTLIG